MNRNIEEFLASNIPAYFSGDLGDDFSKCADLVYDKPGSIDHIPPTYKPYFIEVLVKICQSQHIEMSTVVATWQRIAREGIKH